ncbi:hypothetical protein SprV_0501769200 [Sparganum proliferum]
MRRWRISFAIRNDTVEQLPLLPQGTNDRLMSLHLPPRGSEFASIVSVHVPVNAQLRRSEDQILRKPARSPAICAEGEQDGCPCETRFTEQGQLEEVGAGYTFFSMGHPKAERRDAGVSFAIRNDTVEQLLLLPQGTNDRPMSLPPSRIRIRHHLRNADAQPLPTCPRCQRTFRARIGLVGHLRINCASRTSSTIVVPPASSSSSLRPTNSDSSSEPPISSSSSSPSSSSSSSSSSPSPSSSSSFSTSSNTTTTTTPSSSSYTTSSSSTTTTTTPSSSSYTTSSSSSSTPSSSSYFSSSSSSTAPMTAAQAAVSHITNPATTTDTTPTASDSSDEDQDYTCPHCDRTFTSRIGLVGHLRIHRTETGEPVPGAPTYTHHTRLHCPHCPRTFTHRMGLFGHMRTHESGIDRSTDSSTTPDPTPTPSLCDPTALPATDTNTTDFTCPHCQRTFTSRIGLVGHLRIHRTETGAPVPGAPIYTHQARLTCPHFPRTFRHRMGLFGHMRIHDDLR